MIFLLISVLFINHSSLFINPAFAAESSPSAATKSKLEELKKEIASKAAKLKQEISSKLQNKAYVGTIKTLSKNSFTLATANGPKIVAINQDTVYINQNQRVKIKSLSIANLETEYYIAALGDVDDTSVLTAKKIILLPAKDEQVKQTMWAQVASKSEKFVTVKDKAQKNQTLAISNSTIMKEGSEEIDISKISNGDIILVSGYPGEEGIFEASLLYILPENFTPKALEASESAKIATSSASSKPKMSPTSSAKPKSPTPKPTTN